MIYPLGNTTVTWTVKDASGNTTVVTQLVTVIDNVLPLITAPISLEVISNAGCDATGVNLGNPITSDNCGVASVTNDAPTTFLLGTTTVIWTVTDNTGNIASATQTVVVVDLVSPTAVLNDITITLPIGSNAVIDASMIDAGTFDNCGEVTFQLSQTSFGCEHIGQNSISVVVSDDLGNTTTETVLVTVIASGIDSDFDGIDDSCDDEIIDDVVVPTGFTPDGDGINDQFVIVGLEENNSVSLKVFNRYGNSVYVNDNYQNDWNGMSSFTNLDLPDGTYFYVLAIDNVDSKSGYVYINRVY
jgi:gliding motility-associated-like protein